MSHFTVAVFTKPNGKTLEELLAPYDEGITYDRYVEYTKAELIDKSKKEIAEYATTGHYAEYIKDPDDYKKNCENMAHLKYLEFEFPQRLKWTDEEHYLHAIEYYSESKIGEDGEVYSTYNPKSKWDWYKIGGRWQGMLNGLDSAKVSDASFDSDFRTFAVVTPDGEWFERGSMGWWACVSNEEKDWEDMYKERFIDTADPSWTITIVDCHI